jgi:4'-phosphopantetheinyl transferase
LKFRVLQSITVEALRAERDAVHIWNVSLSRDYVRPQDRAILCAAEIARADAFRFVRDAAQYVQSRSTLKRVLGIYLDLKPAEVGFRYSSHGKPELDLPGRQLHFNLSHSHDLAVIAVSGDIEVGIDVERRTDLGYLDLASRFFAPCELQDLQKSPCLPDRFFHIWTRKEACLKAIGTGLSTPLNAFDVLGDAALDEFQLCHLTSWQPAEGYYAAVAMRGHRKRLVHFTPACAS